MKFLMSLGVMTLLFASVVYQQVKEKKLETPAIITQLYTESQEACYSDTQVTKTIAETWEEAYNIYQSEKNIVGTRAYPPRYHFNTDQIQSLKDEKDSFNEQNINMQIDGVRIYYGVHNLATNDGPGYILYMRNIICGGSFNSIVNPKIAKATIALMEGEPGNTQGPSDDFVDESAFTTDSGNWDTYRNTNFGEMPLIKGYNYSWAQINDAIENQGLSIHVGLKAITPEEGLSVYGDSNLTEAEQVLCNIVYTGQPDNEYNGAVLFDFAKPCPTYCN